MKQLALFILLSLFIISCGGDDDPITPIDTQSESLWPIADGNKWYMHLQEYNLSNPDETYEFYYTFKSKGKYTYEGNSVTLYSLYMIDVDDTTDTYELSKIFEFGNYAYYAEQTDIDMRKIIGASIAFATHIDKEGLQNIGGTIYDVKKIEYEFDGKTHRAWEMITKDSTSSYNDWSVFVPGIGPVFQNREDKETGDIREQKLYKYELH